MNDVIDYENMSDDQKRVLFDDWYKRWLNHDCKLQAEDSCDFCWRFWKACKKMNIKCPINFM